MNLDKLRELLNAATPGPWESPKYYPHLIFAEFNDDPMQIATVEGLNIQADAHLIVALVNAAPELLAIVAAVKSYLPYRPPSRVEIALEALDAKLAATLGGV